jgi:hypothetical protein
VGGSSPFFVDDDLLAAWEFELLFAERGKNVGTFWKLVSFFC